ncbi:MAG TPA: tRNA (N6-isopentenyl adenosine(37)-C2)-methylthiotransferase MiaB [Chthonomonadaceae bacterium]|nr:tRNA (N6-isopentenyl adenosine(37)-C2)-methylthiotransferase MiaB [Chthonomonadaceae bacterium]
MIDTALKPAIAFAGQPKPADSQADGRSYHVMTWGCQMNEEDSEQMGLYMRQLGYRETGSAETADVVLLNTCSVRAKPEEKVWSELGKLKELKRERPGMIIGVCGCMAQVESAEIQRRAPHVDLVVGTGNISALPALVTQVRETGRAETEAIQLQPRFKRRHVAALTALALPARKGAIVTDVPLRQTERAPKLKAHVPIMYGCDKFCTFCIVPYTRGRERSRPTVEILEEIERLAASGTREVTLLGQTVNSYGKNLAEGRVPFCDLLERIDAIRGLARIRFTSPYPRDFTDALIDTIGRLEKVCEHVHLPLQVADDDLLAEMHRGYTVSEFEAIVDKLRERVPGIAITTDVMLGYPGETDSQFRNTMRFVERTRFDSAFMFAYSPRPNTKAALREDQLPQAVKVERLNALIALQNGITTEINRSQVGREFEVLVEGPSERDATRLTGYTRTLKTVNFTVPAGANPAALAGKLATVRAVQAHLTGFTGEYAE